VIGDTARLRATMSAVLGEAALAARAAVDAKRRQAAALQRGLGVGKWCELGRGRGRLKTLLDSLGESAVVS
jgi:hypothetical protein